MPFGGIATYRRTTTIFLLLQVMCIVLQMDCVTQTVLKTSRSYSVAEEKSFSEPEFSPMTDQMTNKKLVLSVLCRCSLQTIATLLFVFTLRPLLPVGSCKAFFLVILLLTVQISSFFLGLFIIGTWECDNNDTFSCRCLLQLCIATCFDFFFTMGTCIFESFKFLSCIFTVASKNTFA